MKGIFLHTLKELVQEKFGSEKWAEIARRSNLRPDFKIFIYDDLDYEFFTKMVQKTIEVLEISESEFWSEFAKYWMFKIAPNYFYRHFFHFKNARDFILNLGNIHKNALASFLSEQDMDFVFDFEIESENSLIVTYQSPRKMFLLMTELLKIIGLYYNEKLDVEVINDKQIRVIFLKD